MAKPFKILRDKMPPEVRIRSEKLADEMIREIRLTELRDALGSVRKSLLS